MNNSLERDNRVGKEVLNHSNMVITIDGSKTAGKRLVAEQLAQRYDLTVLDTGKAIGALALLAIEHNLVKTDDTNVTTVPVDFSDQLLALYEGMPNKLHIEKPRPDERMARIMVGKRDMRGELLAFRKQKAIDNLSAMIAASPNVREKLYDLWRQAVKDLGGVVVIGRKTGVDLLPDAQIKLYMYASPQASAAYRVTHDPTATLHKGTEELYICERDGRDTAQGLLERPKDALVIDTSDYIVKDVGGIAELVDHITAHINSRFTVR